MNTINSFLLKNPRYPLSTQYAPVSDVMNCVISFFNYFDQIFRNSNTAVTLHLFFFDKYGNSSAQRVIQVAANESLQFDARAEGVISDGMVAVAAIPESNIDLVNTSGIKIRSNINTGFYIKWENLNGGCDLMHEWTPVQTTSIPLAKHHIGFIAAQSKIDHGLILMNPVAQTGAVSRPLLVLRESGQSASLAKKSLEPIPALGTQVLHLSSIFPDFPDRIASGQPLILDIIAENLSPPLTAEWNGQGDFHFHHI